MTYTVKLNQYLADQTAKLELNENSEITIFNKKEIDVIDKLLAEWKSTNLNSPFVPLFKWYRDTLHCDTVPYRSKFPFEKTKIPNELRDLFDDEIYDKISSNYEKIDNSKKMLCNLSDDVKDDAIKSLENVLKSITIDDWLLSTLSRSTEPLLHHLFEESKESPEFIALILKYVPTIVWFCPWNTDCNNFTPLQLIAEFIHEKNYSCVKYEVHKQLKSHFEQFHFLKLSDEILKSDTVLLRCYVNDFSTMYTNVPWYLCFKAYTTKDVLTSFDILN